MSVLTISENEDFPLLRMIQLTSKDANGETNLGGVIGTVDLENFSKKGHTHKTNEVEELEQLLVSKANKLHSHEIENINSLKETLKAKSNEGHTHTISEISNINAIKNIDSLTTKESIVQSAAGDAYTVRVVDSTGNLSVMMNDIQVAEYSKSLGQWMVNINEQSLEAFKDEIENMVSEANKTQFDSILNYVKGQDAVINTKIDNNYNALLTRIQALENKLGVTGGDDNKYDELLTRIEALENKKELALTRINLYNE